MVQLRQPCVEASYTCVQCYLHSTCRLTASQPHPNSFFFFFFFFFSDLAVKSKLALFMATFFTSQCDISAHSDVTVNSHGEIIRWLRCEEIWGYIWGHGEVFLDSRCDASAHGDVTVKSHGEITGWDHCEEMWGYILRSLWNSLKSSHFFNSRCDVSAHSDVTVKITWWDHWMTSLWRNVRLHFEVMVVLALWVATFF